MPLKSSISSHVRISYRFYEFVTTRYTTDFYIINSIISCYIVGINQAQSPYGCRILNVNCILHAATCTLFVACLILP